MAGQQGFYIGRIEGKQETLAALNELKPRLYGELVDRMAQEAEAIAADINSGIPSSAPLSGFESHGGRTAWANRGTASAVKSVTVIGSAAEAEWPVYKVMLGGYASAVTDIAGAGGGGSSLQGQAMIAGLNAGVGRASRWVWPVGKKHTKDIEKRMDEACKKIETAMTAELSSRKAG